MNPQSASLASHGNNAAEMAVNATGLPESAARGKTIPSFVPTPGELFHLFKYWATRAITDQFRVFLDLGCGPSDSLRINSAWDRVDEIGSIIGPQNTEKALSESYEEMAQRFGRASDWTLFRYGTMEEQRVYQDKGGQGLSDFAPGEAEDLAAKVMERIFREAPEEAQAALLKEELTRCAKGMKAKVGYPHEVVEIFGVYFPLL